jgi:hypothetical protein
VATSIAVQRRDRPWLDAYVSVLCGPFAMPSTEALREAVSALAERYPYSRLTWRPDSRKRRWHADRLAESIVAERDWDDGVDPGTRLEAIIRDESLEPPLTLIRYPNVIGLKMSHGVGDGRLFLTVMASALQAALTGEVGQWPVQRSGRFPLAAAAVRTFGRHPTLIKAAMADRIPLETINESDVTRRWSPSRRTCHTSMTREQVDQVSSWGKEFAPTASGFALQVALALRGLQKAGLEVSREVRVIADLRRYLGWRYLDGNFVAGVPMNLRWDMSVEQISSSMKATNASGRPLAGQVLTSLRGATAMPVETSVGPNQLPRVTFSNMGRSSEIDSLPFLSKPPTVYAGSVPPEGPLGLTILTGEISQLMTINMTFHDNVVDPAVVIEAMGLITSDPIALLSDPAGRR